LFALLAAVAVSLFLHAPDTAERGASTPLLQYISYAPASYFAALAAVVLVMVPAIILCRAAAGFGSFGVLMNSDYMSLLICALLSWAAAYFPLAIVRSVLGFHLPALYFAANLYFVVLMALSVRTIFGTGFWPALGMTVLGSAAGVLGVVLFAVLGPGRHLLLSPLLLYYLYATFASDVRSFGQGLRSRQHLRRQLELATNNPRDADAHYQLGLIYQKRRQYTEAVARFQRAVEIDPSEADAHMQLGRIAREQGRFDDAIRHLQTAAALDDKLALSDVWRELGAALFGLSRLEDAAAALAKFTDRRAYDPEGLYWYGKTLKQIGRDKDARETFERAIEAVKTMPSHRRAQVRKWGGLAKTELREGQRR
jgi:tetratricopeptide (TPR) repeat protein